MYQPKFRLDLDYLNDRNARDRYYDQAKTLRGVSVLAMSFLDNSLGAGLHDIQVQADQNTQAEFLKQVNWSLEKLASPDRAQVFRDTDEKLEACLEEALTERTAKKRIANTTRERVDLNCPDFCGTPPNGSNPYENTNTKTDWSRQGNGSYQYCVCCAQGITALNRLREDEHGPIGLLTDDNRTWTLVDRVFWGVQKNVNLDINVDLEGDDPKEVLKAFTDTFKKIFGDYVIRTVNRGQPKEHLGTIYQAPAMSPERLVYMNRNRCADLDRNNSNVIPIGNCGLNEDVRFKVKYGICHSVGKLLDSHGLKGTDVYRDILNEYEAEASAGIPFTGGLADAIISLGSEQADRLDLGQERLESAQAINVFCDTSAISAAARQVIQMKRVANDMVTINSQVTSKDKAIFLGLIERYMDWFRMKMVEQQVRASLLGANTGILIEHDRQVSSNIAAINESWKGAISNRGTSALAGASFSGGLKNTDGGASGTARSIHDGKRLTNNPLPHESNIGAKMEKLIR